MILSVTPGQDLLCRSFAESESVQLASHQRWALCGRRPFEDEEEALALPAAGISLYVLQEAPTDQTQIKPTEFHIRLSPRCGAVEMDVWHSPPKASKFDPHVPKKLQPTHPGKVAGSVFRGLRNRSISWQ